MEQITEHELRQFAPNARRDYVQTIINGWDELRRANITTNSLHFCGFLGETAHETGGFTIVRENTSWTAAQMCTIWPSRFKTKLDPRIAACGRDPVKLANLAYSARKELGNTGGNDGWDYRGGGFLQTTGRYNFRRVGASIGVALEDNPQFIDNCDISLKAAIHEWTKTNCNSFAARGYMRAVGNAINRGNAFSKYEPIGFKSRQEWYRKALLLFGDDKDPLPGLALGAYGSEVEVLQRRLRELNYGVGAADKVFGPVLARAVAAFKLDHKRAGGGELEPDEVVGERTWAALNGAQPIVMAERKDATVKDLIASGSKEAAALKGGNDAAALVTTASLGVGVQKAAEGGMLDGMSSSLGWLPTYHSFLVPVIEALSWGLKNVAWVATLLGGVWFWTKGRHALAARLQAHIKGWNLGR